MTWAIDLDGVLWTGEEPIDGSAEAVGELRGRGERVIFLTNNSSQPVRDYVAKLEEMGVPAEPDDVVTSAQAAAMLLDEGATALVCAGVGVEEALRDRGVRTVREGEADAVVVGWHREFDYERLTAAASAVAGGARLIGTNDDATYPLPGGERLPGGGALLAAVAYASGAEPEVAGKPNQPMADLVAERVGKVDVVVGDRPTTDGLLAHRLDARFVLVLSGVTDEDQLPGDPVPDEVAADLAAVVTGKGRDPKGSEDQ
ncbi:MAG: HAD-IIA family hydrolase [Actinomycetota bacterium]|nr:HAD-IIA family hydrolase [Actinomycetota bacterium]